MSTTAVASGIIPFPIETVWKQIRQFDFPARLLTQTIAKVELEEHANATTVGGVRKITWKNGQWRRQRLIELSDQYHRITWETIEADPPTETSAIITTVKLYRVTETNSTLLEWSSDFSADVKGSLVVFEQKSYLENIREIRDSIKHYI
jgi:hypothetical protein